MRPWVRTIVANGVVARAQAALGRGSKGPPVVVKVIATQGTGGIRSIRGVRATLSYIGRLGAVEGEEIVAELSSQAGFQDGDESERPVVRDEYGEVVADPMAALASWGLLSEKQNLTPVADAWFAHGNSRALWAKMRVTPEREWQSAVQARHLVLSARAERYGDDYRIEEAALGTIMDTFCAWGHPVLWAMHRDHSDRPHVHLLVGSRTIAGDRLDFDRGGLILDGVRETFATYLRIMGIEASAERVADRPEIAAAARAGQPVLTETVHWQARRAGGTVLRTRVRRDQIAGFVERLEEASPSWVRSYGAAWMERELGRPAPVLVPPVPARQDLARALAPVYGSESDGDAAAASFQMLKAADARLALWALEHRPQLFGPARKPTEAEVLRLAAALPADAAQARPRGAARMRLENEYIDLRSQYIAKRRRTAAAKAPERIAAHLNTLADAVERLAPHEMQLAAELRRKVQDLASNRSTPRRGIER